MKLTFLAFGLTWVALFALNASSAPVTEAEAIATAKWWFVAEVNAATTPLTAAEKQDRIAHSGQPEVSYILARDTWQTTRKVQDQIAAYVVSFKPSGFVVVSGEDGVDPVLVFDAVSTFKWKGAEKDYLSHYLGRCAVGAAEQARAKGAASAVHTNWTQVRGWIKSGASRPTGPGDSSESGPGAPGPTGTIYVLWPTAWWGQGDHYNDVCVAQNGGNNVPTGCTATAMAIKMRFHEWPLTGNGSHSYNDTWGSIQYAHSVNFGSHTYYWDSMPTNNLTADNSYVANLMYDCGVAVDMDYEAGGSGAWLYATDMNGYFRYRGTTEIWSGTVSAHTASMSYSVRCGLPVILSTSVHTVVASGYRDTVSPYFYLNLGWGGGGSWYNLDGIPVSDPTIDVSYPYSSPNNYAYVSASAGAGGNGDLDTPYQTVSAGQTGVASGGVLWLVSGTYTGSGNTGITLTKPMTINTCLGSATIGN